MIKRSEFIHEFAKYGWFVGIEMLNKYGTEWQVKTTNVKATEDVVKRIGLYMIKVNIIEVVWDEN